MAQSAPAPAPSASDFLDNPPHAVTQHARADALLAGPPFKNPMGAPFNAVGDGVANDRAALQSWLAEGGRLILPPGDYLIDDSLTPVSDTTLLACWGATIRMANGGDAVMLDINGVSRVTIDGLHLDGNRLNQTGTTRHGIQVRSDAAACHTIRIKDCFAESVRGHGIYQSASANTVTDLWIDNCKTRDTLEGGIKVNGDTVRVTITDCNVLDTVDAASGNGITVSNADGANSQLAVKGCHVTNAARMGFEIFPTIGVVFSGNTSSGSGDMGMSLVGLEDATVADNVVVGAVNYGIELGILRGTAAGNVVRDVTGEGIVLNGCGGLVVSANTVEDPTLNGIVVVGPQSGNLSLTDNVIRNPGSGNRGIYIDADGASPLVISGNNISGINDGAGILFNGTATNLLQDFTIADNTITGTFNSSNAGIQVAAATRGTISGNNINRTAAAANQVGLKVEASGDASARIAIVGNVISGFTHATFNYGVQLGTLTSDCLLTANILRDNTIPFNDAGTDNVTTGNVV
jgi:hypothetical protein